MTDYWTAAPFISYDGLDENKVRAEVRVKKGFGLPISIEPSDKGKAVKVTFDTGHPRFKSYGWIPKEDPIYAVAEEAMNNGTPLEFRIENKRRPGVDRSKTMAELLEGDTTTTLSNALVAVRPEDDDWVTSPTAVTRIDEDPRGGNGSYSANDNSREELGIGAANNARSYTPQNSNDPGSLAVAVPVTILNFVHEYFKKLEINDVMDEKKRILAVKAIMKACNDAQLQVCDGMETPDMGAYSHVRARQIVFLVVESYYPLNAEVLQSAEELSTWEENVVKKAVGIWNWSIKEVEKVSS